MVAANDLCASSVAACPSTHFDRKPDMTDRPRFDYDRSMTDENETPPISKLTRSKQRWAREGRFLTGKTSRPEEQRLPPGQHLIRDWPTLDLGLTPNISRERWRLDVY